MSVNQEHTRRRDEQLIIAALQGDTSAYGMIVERYWNMTVALAISKINNLIEAEDIAQESFIKAYLNLNNLRHPDRFAGWLSKIVIQQCIDHSRKNIKVQSITNLDSKIVFSSNPGLNDEQVSFIRKTVAKLPDKFKEVVIMRFVAGLTSVEIAKELGKRQGTIRTWLHRAYEILRKELTPFFEEVK